MQQSLTTARANSASPQTKPAASEEAPVHRSPFDPIRNPTRTKTKSTRHYDENFYYYQADGAPPAAERENDGDSSRSVKRDRRKSGHNTSTSPSASSGSRDSAPKRKSTGLSTEKSPIAYNNGRWTGIEHFRFLEALKLHGKEWQKV